MELNGNSVNVRRDGIPNMKLLLAACLKNGCHIALDTDAHSTTQLQGNMPPLLAMLEEMQFPQELVVNATRQNLVNELKLHGRICAESVSYTHLLARNLTELIVVCNGKLSKQGRAAFEEFTDQIIVRENKGLDVWAYKTALDHYGWQRLSEFDEVVMTNSTLMGPEMCIRDRTDALSAYTGTLLLVTHDRYLMQTLGCPILYLDCLLYTSRCV